MREQTSDPKKKKKKKKKIRSHVKQVKMQQKRHPVSRAKYKRKLRKARRQDFFRIFFKTIAALAIAILALYGAFNLWLYKTTGETVRSCRIEAEETIANSTAEDFAYSKTTYIYADNGTKIAELSEDEDATYLTYDEIPADVVNAFVAVEDRTFWTNNGIDLKGIARVLINYVISRGETAEGASTITQQLARGTYLTSEKTLLRKIKEIFLALEMTEKYTKEEIMEFYCNTCCFANGIYGVEDAAQTYFDTSVDELSLSQVAYICAIPNRPEYYNPLSNSENAITRRDKILEDMEECGYITSAACAAAIEEEIEIYEVEDEDEFYNYETTYAIYCAVRYFMELDGFEFQYEFDSTEDYEEYNTLYNEYYSQAKHKLYTGGYEIYTTMNLEAQEALQEILDEQLSFSTDTDEDSGIYELQGAMTVIDNETGKVIAMIGGRSQEEISQTYSLNRGYQGYAQPGSSFKPLVVYTPALEEGYSASSTLKNIDVDTAKTSTSAEISSMSGTSYTLRNAVEQSRNGCAYWLFNAITPSVGLSYVTAMEFSRIVPDDYTLSASLGGLTYGVSTLEMANAYYTLENHGEYTHTTCLASILDSDGDEIYEEAESKTVYSTAAADEMTDILQGVLTSGTASGSSWYSYTDTEAAGKTGTTDDNKAGWFCGYTPYYTIAVWVGCDTPTTVYNLQGSTYPLYIWEEAMLYLIADLPAATFELEGTYSNSSSVTYEEEEEEEEEEELEEEELEEEEGEESEIDTTEGNTGDTTQGTVDTTTETPSTDSSQTTQEDTGTETDTGGSSSETQQDSGGDSSAGTESGTDSGGTETQSQAETQAGSE